MSYERGQKTSLKSIHRPPFKTWSWEAWVPHRGRLPRSKSRNQALSSPPPSSRLAPYSKAGPSRRKKPFLPRPPGHSNTLPSLCRSKRFPPNRTDIPRLTPFQSVPLWWTWEVGAQPERTRTKKGRTSGQRGVWRKCRSWGPRTGTL